VASSQIDDKPANESADESWGLSEKWLADEAWLLEEGAVPYAEIDSLMAAAICVSSDSEKRIDAPTPLAPADYEAWSRHRNLT
jgi:hypothetical protein